MLPRVELRGPWTVWTLEVPRRVGPPGSHLPQSTTSIARRPSPVREVRPAVGEGLVGGNPEAVFFLWLWGRSGKGKLRLQGLFWRRYGARWMRSRCCLFSWCVCWYYCGRWLPGGHTLRGTSKVHACSRGILVGSSSSRASGALATAGVVHLYQALQRPATGLPLCFLVMVCWGHAANIGGKRAW